MNKFAIWFELGYKVKNEQIKSQVRYDSLILKLENKLKQHFIEANERKRKESLKKEWMRKWIGDDCYDPNDLLKEKEVRMVGKGRGEMKSVYFLKHIQIYSRRPVPDVPATPLPPPPPPSQIIWV